MVPQRRCWFTLSARHPLGVCATQTITRSNRVPCANCALLAAGEESNLTSALATYGSNEAPPVAHSGSEADTDADGELLEPTSAACNGDAAAQAQALPNAAVNPEPPSSMNTDMQDEQQAGEQQVPADPLDLLPPEYRTSPGEVDPVLQVSEACCSAAGE
jgi:hypothetical protein